MKKIYFTARKFFVLLFLAMLFAQATTKAQVLSAGQIAFTGYHSTDASDRFSFVLLVNVPAATVINFTDNGWLSTGVFRAGEQTVTWTTGSALVAGREVTISGVGGGTATAVISGSNISAGTCTGTMPSLSVNGDQVLAYQGTVASPTFISAIHMNVYTTLIGDPVSTTAAAWDGTANTTNSCALPPGLTNGTNAIWIGTQDVSSSERNNAVYNCASGAPLATPAQVRAAVNNQANWNAEFALSGAVPSWPLPSGCAYLASIFPVNLTNFTGRNAISHIALSWNGENEQGFSHYELERSFDGSNFERVATINAIGGSLRNTYSFNDADAVRHSNSTVFYRLRLVDRNGFAEYSTVVPVKLFGKSNVVIDQLPNPFTGTLQFNIVSREAATANIRLTDMGGRVVLTETQRLSAGDNRLRLSRTAALNNGIYTMEVTLPGNERKLVKLIKGNL